MTEKEIILTSILNCRRVDLYIDPKPLTEKEENQLFHIVQRRRSGEPLQYILKSCEFMGLKFFVDKRVLIPRPETELLVEAVIEKSRESNQHLKILELGTGSANIAVSLAKYIKNSHVTTADISNDALCVAKENAELNGVLDKIHFVHSDLFSFFWENPRMSSLFDIIISNPPYIKKDAIASLSKEVQQEPKAALDGGVDGLDFYRRMAKEAGYFLKENGFIFLEMGDGQKDSVVEIFQNTQKFFVKNIIKDYRQTERILIMEHKKHG